MDCSMPRFLVLHCLPEFSQLRSIESVIPSNHLIFYRPLLLLPSTFHSISLFQWVGSSHQVAKVSELQLQYQSFQWIFRIDFLYDWLVWSVCSPRDSQETSSKFKSISSLVLSLLQLSHAYITTGKAIALTGQISVGKMMSLLFSMLFRFVIAFIPRSKCLLVSWLQWFWSLKK